MPLFIEENKKCLEIYIYIYIIFSFSSNEFGTKNKKQKKNGRRIKIKLVVVWYNRITCFPFFLYQLEEKFWWTWWNKTQNSTQHLSKFPLNKPWKLSRSFYFSFHKFSTSPFPPNEKPLRLKLLHLYRPQICLIVLTWALSSSQTVSSLE